MKTFQGSTSQWKKPNKNIKFILGSATEHSFTLEQQLVTGVIIDITAYSSL